MLSPKDSPRGQLLSQYVCVRIPRMDNVDIGLFDYDRYNTLYFFILNADEQIYMRYGGRDAASQDSYLSLNSLELALKKGLELHKDYVAGKIEKTPRPKPAFPREIPLLVERTFARNQCVECHLIGDFQLQEREQNGTLDKPQQMFRSPDFKTIGLQFDVPRGLVVKSAEGVAGASGLKPEDLITKINGKTVWTFADLQYEYDKLPRATKQMQLTVNRSGTEIPLTVNLPNRWWWIDLRYKQLTIDPRVYFESTALSAEQKKQHDLPADGFASTVSRVDDFAQVLKSHELKVGDIIVGVDGVGRDDYSLKAEDYIRLRKKAGDSVTLDVIRDGKRIQLPLRTFQMNFRK